LNAHSPSPKSPFVSRLAIAAAVAIPAYLLTHESFRPIEHRAHLQGREATWSFALAHPEPLFLEFEFAVQAPEGEATGIRLRINDRDLDAVPAEQLYVTQRAMPLVPVEALRAGDNRLHVFVDGPPSATFDMNLRVHNYYGINPRFPRAFVVSDEAVWHAFQQRAIAAHVLRFGAFYLASLAVMWIITRISRQQPAFMLASTLLLWAVLLYGLATLVHIWLSIEAVLVILLVPWLLTTAGVWMWSHPRAVARIAVPAVLTIVLLEIGLRVVNYVKPSSIFYTDSYSRYRGQPGAPHFDSHLNALGFNDADHERAKAAGVYRIAALGDSVAFGVVPYRANYLTLLEDELAADAPVEVINLGVPGTEPKDYLAMLMQEGLAFDPDLVMVSFYIGNDFEAAAKKFYELSYAATSVYFLWRLSTAGMPAAVRVDGGGTIYQDEEPSMAWERFLEIEVDRAPIYARDDAGLRARAGRAVGYLRDIRHIATRAGAKTLVVIIPTEVQMDVDLQEQVARAQRSTRDAFDFGLPNRVLAAELSNEGIPVLDLLPVFEQEARQTRLYKPRDTHWNIAGNRLAASAIADFLREQQLLGARATPRP
jgi:hypothetical protein